MRTYPKLQLYVTRDPIVVEEKFTLPCSGLGGSPQSTATKKQHGFYRVSVTFMLHFLTIS